MKQEEKTRLTKEKIIAAAIEEFGSKGYLGASLNNICAAGIPKGLLYHNFENKDAIYLACVGQCFLSFTKSLEAADINGDLYSYMAARLSFIQNSPMEAHIFFETILEPPAHLQGDIQELRAEFDSFNLKLYSQMLSRLPLRKDVSGEDAIEYFVMMQNMFNCYFSSSSFRAMPFSDKINAHEASMPKLLDFMLYGIAERKTGEKD